MKTTSRFCNHAICEVLLLGTISLLLVQDGIAQITAATVSGVVKDQTGAILPGVSVDITNLGTGLVRSVTTEENGLFAVPGLPPGKYEARAALQGFKAEVQANIELEVGQQASIAECGAPAADERLNRSKPSEKLSRQSK